MIVIMNVKNLEKITFIKDVVKKSSSLFNSYPYYIILIISNYSIWFLNLIKKFDN